MIRSRKGVELAINTIIVLILGLVILSMGFALVWQIVAGGEKLSEDFSQTTRDQLKNMLQKGQLVALYPTNVEVNAGEQQVIGLMIQNRLEDSTEFDISVSWYDINGDPMDGSDWYAINPPGEIESRTSGEAALALRPPDSAEQGVYTIVVSVTYDTPPSQYDSKRSATISVR